MAMLAAQLGLHLAYGDETFLYSLHWGPLLALTACHALHGATRWAARAVAGLLFPLLVFNNLIVFERCVHYINGL
jgi:hypothetical protein